MAGKRVWYSSKYASMHIEGTGDALLMDSGHAFASLDVVGPASLTSMRIAMIAVFEDYPYGNVNDSLYYLPRFSVTWSTESSEDLQRSDFDQISTAPVCLALMRSGELLVEFDVPAGPSPRSEEDTWADGTAILKRWLQRRGGRLVSLSPSGLDFRPYWIGRMSVPIRGRTVMDAHLLGSEAISYLEAHTDGVMTIESLIDLLRDGHADALLGMSESQLLEAKRSLHIDDDKGRLELAKDVSALANSHPGGVLVVGLATRSQAGKDIISTVSPMPNTGQVRKVRAVLDRLVYPPIQQLDVSLVPAGVRHHPGEYQCRVVKSVAAVR